MPSLLQGNTSACHRRGLTSASHPQLYGRTCHLQYTGEEVKSEKWPNLSEVTQTVTGRVVTESLQPPHAES